MRQIWVPKTGAPDVLEIREARDPLPGAHELRVRVEAIGISGADLALRQGCHPDRPKLPAVPGFELAGHVDSVGSAVGTDWIERPVLAWLQGGAYADVVCVPERQTFARPKGMDAAAGAALPLDYLTAYQLMVVASGLQEGLRTLVHAPGHGVGLACVQLARRIRARVIALAPSAQHDLLKSLGAEAAVDPEREDVAGRLRELTAGRGVELALDAGGPASLRTSFEALAATGRLGRFGLPAVLEPRVGLRERWLAWRAPRLFSPGLVRRNRGVFGVDVDGLWNEFDRVDAWMEDLLLGCEAGDLRPVIAGEFDFDDAPAAHRAAEAAERPGKTLLRLSGRDLG